MRTYEFRYLNGQSMPYKSISAQDDDDFKTKLKSWEQESGFKHVAGTEECRIHEHYAVP